VKLTHAVCLLTLIIVPVYVAQSHGAADGSIQRTLKLEAPPLDMAVSLNGRWIFVLTDQGSLLIYSAEGILNDTINIGSHIDQIKVGPQENLLLLGSRKNRTVQFLVLDFVRSIDISGSPFKGNADAPVAIAVFSDFQCLYCKQLLPVFDEVLEKYPEQVKVVFKNFPLRSHQFAVQAAVAALAADKQGKFWEFHDQLFDNFQSLSDQKIMEIAQALKINQEAFEKEMRNPKILTKVRNDFQEGNRIGVRSTPSVFINGRLLKHNTLKEFQTFINKELETLKKNKRSSAS